MSDDTIPHSDDPFWKWEPLDTVGLNDDIKSLDDLGITPRDVSDEYDDDSDEYRSDQVYDSLDNIYHFDQKKDLPKLIQYILFYIIHPFFAKNLY